MARASAAGTAGEDDFLEFAAVRTGHLFRTVCLLTGGDTHLAEDLVQEALGRIYAQWYRTSWFAPRARIENPAGYAHTVLVRAFLSHRRRRSTSGRLLAAPLPGRDQGGPSGRFENLVGHAVHSGRPSDHA
ncbi:hypothetical protein [Kitasatospora herbaricolor]|jgi:DNA-directed RNA polymerase specialized sigma24 family protein|uniref:hypothetical protein n=1 Tax=Kitasatospora herbaricolor TaxID=68217 RepID=UPI0039A4F33E